MKILQLILRKLFENNTSRTRVRYLFMLFFSEEFCINSFVNSYVNYLRIITESLRKWFLINLIQALTKPLELIRKPLLFLMVLHTFSINNYRIRKILVVSLEILLQPVTKQLGVKIVTICIMLTSIL